MQKNILDNLKFSSEPEIINLSKEKLSEIKIDEELISSATPEKISEESEKDLDNYVFIKKSLKEFGKLKEMKKVPREIEKFI